MAYSNFRAAKAKTRKAILLQLEHACPGKENELMEYVIAFAVGGAVALYTLLVRRWLKEA